ncbi:MAG TPA: hypothetical protein DEH78_08330, partial [Solibacterales bacterium]|nr:hypothetical protein [Bryobacterales bacterium]
TRCCFLVLFPGRAPLRHSGHGWRPGGAFCFRKGLWAAAPFRDTAQSEDTWFLRDHDPELIRLCRPDPEDYIVVRHGANTWTRMTTGPADRYLAACPAYPKTLAEVTSPETARWFRRLRAQ